MPGLHHDRHTRLAQLERLLPQAGTAPAQCPDAQRLLAGLGEAYGEGAASARLRAIQRDLLTLVKAGRIATANPGAKPLRYCRRAEDPGEDPLIWEYTTHQIRALVEESVPARQLDQLWARLRTGEDAPLLDAARLRILPDSLRLRPPLVSPRALGAVITALARDWALDVRYENAEGERKDARLHPQALVQRGPIPYLFALKNDESEPVRLYALHRLLRARALPEVPARRAQGFDLDRAIAEGRVDFGQGEMVALELKVRGYLAQVLQVCPLSADQREADEPEGAPFSIRVWATVPSTGQLLRWLLGAGPNVDVVAPADLRHTVAVQVAKMGALYGGGGEDPGHAAADSG